LFTQFLARQSARRNVIGTDLDEEKIAIAQRLKLPNLQFMPGDFAKINLADASVITILDVLYLIPYAEQEQLLASCADKLADGGIILLKDCAEKPAWKLWLTQIEESLAVHTFNITLGSERFYFRPRSEWQAIFQKLGFSVETISLDRGYYHPHVVFVARKTR
jgi:2-polyprenyl-3-methyl-5-hydroxy-6-metoxy-1,4-benzoquinol methylase